MMLAGINHGMGLGATSHSMGLGATSHSMGLGGINHGMGLGAISHSMGLGMGLGGLPSWLLPAMIGAGAAVGVMHFRNKRSRPVNGLGRHRRRRYF
jgi:hypothetical protein